MPTQQCVGRHNRGDLAQGLTAQAVCPYGQPAPVVISEPQPSPTELPPEETVLFNQVGDRFPLAALQPAGQDHQ
jgi:hypothetical protein